MISTERRPATPGRGRDLQTMILEVVTGDGATLTFESVLCPREGRARSVAECAPCLDARGPVSGPATWTGGALLACAAAVMSPVAPGTDTAAASAADAAPVSAVMTRAVTALTGDAPLAVARAALRDGARDALPVVDRAGHPVGVLRARDLLADAAGSSGGCVDAMMVRRVSSVAETAPVSEAAALMAFEGVSLVPAVSRDGRVVGVVTALDLVRWLADQDDRGPRQLP